MLSCTGREEQTPAALGGIYSSDGNLKRRGRSGVPLRLAPGEPARERRDNDERRLELALKLKLEPQARPRVPWAVARVPTRVGG